MTKTLFSVKVVSKKFFISKTLKYQTPNKIMNQENQTEKESDKQTDNIMDCMQDEKRHATFFPSPILDVDRGIDFTFKGLGLKGNREKQTVSEDSN